MNNSLYPDLTSFRETEKFLSRYLVRTPAIAWPDSCALREALGPDCSPKIWAKLELFQKTGTFKPRGALTVMNTLSEEEKARGVVAASAGNHAIAVAFAAQELGISATVIIPRAANPARVAACKRYSAKIEFVDSLPLAFERAEEIRVQEGKFFVHPYEGVHTARGTGTVGLEFLSQVPELDILIVAIGGGGLAGGIGCAVSTLAPGLEVIGVEPEGADSMWRSFQAGAPVAIEKARTIADTLGAPRALPYSFGLCRTYLKEVIRVTEQDIISGMRYCFSDLKLAVEPAGAAVVGALLGPLKGSRLHGKKVGLVICGSNIDPRTFADIITGE